MSYTEETKESLWEHLKVVEDERNSLLSINADLLEACELLLKCFKKSRYC